MNNCKILTALAGAALVAALAACGSGGSNPGSTGTPTLQQAGHDAGVSVVSTDPPGEGEGGCTASGVVILPDASQGEICTFGSSGQQATFVGVINGEGETVISQGTLWAVINPFATG